ncbi:hypothetical protein NC653_032861 [Populus alba x Populus x berolinensis]|uniref:Uncharacterized protein n=1 Tax=Populus alba x Populus x berolinensis TaxID=444605 RepID=A0AAD6LSH6_9ROSI|nr:hypothetical protein NC653_032861 [Populus alba x Populus x berolinensis]
MIEGKKDYAFMLQRSRTEGWTSRRVIVGTEGRPSRRVKFSEYRVLARSISKLQVASIQEDCHKHSQQLPIFSLCFAHMECLNTRQATIAYNDGGDTNEGL